MLYGLLLVLSSLSLLIAFVGFLISIKNGLIGLKCLAKINGYWQGGEDNNFNKGVKKVFLLKAL